MKQFWSLVLISLLCFSCTRDADIPLPETDPKLGLFCFLSPGAPIEVVLARVNPLFGPSGGTGTDFVTDGHIWISDGTDTSELVIVPGEDYYVEALPKLTISEGKTYWIWAEATGLPSVSASCKVPLQKVNNMSVNYYGSIKDEDSMFHVSMIWNDIAMKENYYRAEALNIDSLSGNSRTTNEYAFNTRYYSDYGNDGKVLQSGVGIFTGNPVNVESRWIKATLITCETNYYRYHLNIEANIDGNPLAGPTSLYSNVTNGVGCFGAYLQYTIDVRIF